jgi:hypothetical protein
MTPLTNSLNSFEGIIAVSGLMGSEQFINVKYPNIKSVSEGGDTDTEGGNTDTEGTEGTEKYNNDISLLYEIAIGTVLNKLRRKIPNFRYTYSGLYCGVPVDPSKTKYAVERKFEEKLKNVLDKFLKVDSSFLMMDFVDFIKKGELTQMKVVDFILKNVSEKIKNMERTYNYTKLRQFILDIRNEKFQTSIYNQISTVYELYVKSEVSDFDNSLFCSDKNIRVLMLSEFIPNARTLLEMLDELSRDDLFNIFCQVSFALNMAWQEHHFCHSDLHNKNILIRQLDKPITINYSVLVTGWKIINVPVYTDKVAIIIDYSFSRITYEGKIYSQKIENYNDNNWDLDNLLLENNIKVDDKLTALINLSNDLNLRNENFSPKLYEEIIKIFLN